MITTLLGGSWVVVSGVTSRVTIIISHITGLITPLFSTPEPPSVRSLMVSLVIDPFAGAQNRKSTYQGPSLKGLIPDSNRKKSLKGTLIIIIGIVVVVVVAAVQLHRGPIPTKDPQNPLQS